MGREEPSQMPADRGFCQPGDPPVQGRDLQGWSKDLIAEGI